MSKYSSTRGPWDVRDSAMSPDNLFYIVRNPDGDCAREIVAEAYRADDASLIAAAPDLFEACNALIDALAFAIRANVDADMAQEVIDNHGLIKMALNTIAKAEGRVVAK